MEPVINLEGLAAAANTFGQQGFFDHAIIDDFFTENFAGALGAEFPAFDGEVWRGYDNAIELNRASNNWTVFPPPAQISWRGPPESLTCPPAPIRVARRSSRRPRIRCLTRRRWSLSGFARTSRLPRAPISGARY